MKSSASFASRITAAMLIGGLSMLVTLGSASAASYTWTGTGANGNWFSGGFGPYASQNWGGTPTSITSSGTNDFTFNNALTVSNTVNSSGPFSLRNLTFGGSAGAFTINTSSGLTFAASNSSLANNSSNLQTFTGAGGLTLNATTMNINSGAAGISIQSSVLGGGSLTSINKSGSGELTFTQSPVASNAVFNATAGTTNFQAGYTGVGIAATNAAIVNVGGFVTGSINAGGTSKITMNAGSLGPNIVGGNAELINNGQTLADLTVTGGTVTQTGAATYTGTTSLAGNYVNSGTGGVTFSGPVTVSAGNQSFGAAVITGSTILNGGVTTGLKTTSGVELNTGAAVDFNDLAVNTGSDLLFNGGALTINGANYGSMTNSNADTIFGSGFDINFGVNEDGSRDFINTPDGNVDWGGANLNLSLTNTGTIADYTSWNMFDFATQSGDLAAVNLVADASYGTMTFTTALSGNQYETPYGAGVWLSNWVGGQRFIFNQNDGTLTVVPEPSTMVFAGIGAAMLGWHTWTRGRRNARMKLVEEHMRKVGEQRGLV